MNSIVIKIFILALCSIVLVSCHKDLDRFPPNDLTSAEVYSTEAGYKQVLAKVYGSMALTGQIGPAAPGGDTQSPDVKGIDEGTSDFLRLFWNAQELTTDEALVAWNDPGIQDFHNMNWSANNSMLIGLYNRSFYIITLCNEFIRESAPERISSRGISNTTEIGKMRAEARFIRAFQYWVLMDLFGNPAFVNEETSLGASSLPQQINRADLFKYIESELLALEPALAEPKTTDYGRADKAAAWSLLARMYLNAQVYSGTSKWTEAITYSKKVIDANYQLIPDYKQLMLADNHTNKSEFIWTLNYDGLNTQNFGGTTYLVNASVSGDNAVQKDSAGLTGWSGLRTTKNLPELFPGYPNFSTITDRRAQFFMQGQNLEIENISSYSDGYAVIKFRNRTKNGSFGRDPGRTFSDIDFPVFRLAEMYLIYAEAVLRGGSGGTSALALTYFNNLRQRAYGNTSGNVGALDLNLIIDERGRELYWEASRRTDLIRFNMFTEGSYLWPWKGGVRNGTGAPSFRRLFPIPATEVGSNPNIKQNPNY
jgi:hypothetical protein